jgi:hypothetical protein
MVRPAINVQMDVESESSTQNVAADLLGIVKKSGAR